MAEKTEKIYTIPLRRTVVKTERINRSKAAVKTVKAYLLRNFEVADAKLSKGINELIWSRGCKKPPAKIKIRIEIKDKVAFAKLPDEKEVKVAEEKPKGKLESIKEKVAQTGMAKAAAGHSEKK